jgi:signal transduction histidine kinase/CheY-like chemotaxis protein
MHRRLFSLPGVSSGGLGVSAGLVPVAVLMLLPGIVTWQWQTLFFMLGATVAGLILGGLLLLAARKARGSEGLVLEYAAAREAAERTNAQLREQLAGHLRAGAAQNQAQRIEAVGQLTGGVAHDFNNLLTIVLGNVDLLESQPPAAGWDPGTAGRLAAIRGGAERGVTLTRQLLAFGRRQKLAIRPANLNRLIGGMDDLLASALGGSVAREQRLDPALWQAMVDPAQIELVILNLALNARDAMPEGGRLTIETTNTTIASRADEAGTIEPGDPDPGDYVTVTVRDSGIGMPASVLAKVFEPFFTTKPPGVGAGLGLSQVLGTVQQLGGGVRIGSTPGFGTVVRVYLPRTLAPADEWQAGVQRPPTVAGPAPQGTARSSVLVVDDDEAVRSTVAELLSGMGYTVHMAAGGAEALELLRHSPEIDLLLTDVVMPMMSGPALAREVTRIRPSLPVVFMSGYANPQELAGEAGEADRLLHKPFRPSQLARQLEAALGR